MIATFKHSTRILAVQDMDLIPRVGDEIDMPQTYCKYKVLNVVWRIDESSKTEASITINLICINK